MTDIDFKQLGPDSLPIFPLNAVLFPEGRLQLRVFEPGLLDMIARCMQAERTFGICLLDAQATTPGAVHAFGVEARIVDWDLSNPLELGLSVCGERRFQILSQDSQSHGFGLAQVSWLPSVAVDAIAATYTDLVSLLQLVALDAEKKPFSPPYRFDSAEWVGYRYAEFLPIPPIARQRLLELNDTDLRLSIIRAFLVERRLLNSK